MSWIFMAFENDSAHKKVEPFMIELFHDFNKMKKFSAEQEVAYRNVHNHYCSDYINLTSGAGYE